MKIPLTISLLASSRIGSLERCLDSLKPLLVKVPAELIVVYTGTDERVREIAARYTDQIIPFTWCDDFSAARNAGLKHAKGEWFMYIDDDEWFEDVTEICNFFLSGEYKKYGFAYYIQRNYTDWGGIQCSDYPAFRMARRVPNLHFEYPIHEEMFPRGGRHKVFQSYVHHYGYIKDTIKKDNGKSARNVPMLLKDIEEHPDHLKNYLQLVQEYSTGGNWELAEKYCRKGRELCKGTGDNAYQRWFQVYLSEALCAKKGGLQAEQEILSILEKEKPCELVRIILYNLLVAMCEERKAFKEILEYGIEFEKLMVYMDENPQKWEEQSYGYVSEDRAKDPGRLYPARLNCVKAALELQNYDKAEYFLELLPWEEEFRIWQHYPILDHWKEAYAPHLLELFAGLSFDSAYLLFQRMLYEEQKETEETQALFLFRRCLKEIDQPYLQRQLIEKALWEQRDFSPLLDRMDLDSWKSCISEIVKDTPYTDNPKLQEAQENLFNDYPLQRLWLKKLLLEKDLSRGFLMKKELIEALREYAECIESFYEIQYHEEMFSDKSRHLLPVDCRQAFVVLDALEKLDQKQPAEAVRLLRTVLRLYPQMTGVIREVLRLLTHEVENPAETAGAEFQTLAAQMKEAVKGMIEQGQYQEALSVVSQLFPLLPEDMELFRLHQQLLAQLG